jgi:hypothetical protein
MVRESGGQVPKVSQIMFETRSQSEDIPETTNCRHERNTEHLKIAQ